MDSSKADKLGSPVPADRRACRAACVGLVVAACLPFMASPANADPVCDFLRQKIVWNVAVEPAMKSIPGGPGSRAVPPAQDITPDGISNALWFELYAGSKCSARSLAEDLLKAEMILTRQVETLSVVKAEAR